MNRDLLALYNVPGHLIRRVHQGVVASFMEECTPFDITPLQWAVMVATNIYGRSDATRIASLIASDRATTGKVIEILERKSLITREIDAKDKRIKIISLTDTGKKLMQQVQPAVKMSQDKFLSPLTKKEIDELLRVLKKLSHISLDH